MVLRFMGGIEMGDGSDGFRDWGLNCRHAELVCDGLPSSLLRH